MSDCFNVEKNDKGQIQAQKNDWRYNTRAQLKQKESEDDYCNL